MDARSTRARTRQAASRVLGAMCEVPEHSANEAGVRGVAGETPLQQRVHATLAAVVVLGACEVFGVTSCQGVVQMGLAPFETLSGQNKLPCLCALL